VKAEENMERKTGLSVVVAVALAAGPTLGCHHGEPAAPPPRAVRLQEIASAGGATELRYSASVEPEERVALAFKVSGYVRDIARRGGVDGKPRLLQQGDVVARGSELARIADEEYRQRVLRARGHRAAAAATLARARADADRAEKLYAAQSLTRVDYDSARAALDVAVAQLASADADLEAATIDLGDCVVRAPMDSLVISRKVEAGALAAPGTVAFVLADVSEMKAVFGVPERVARALEVGAPLSLELESRPDPILGRITALSPSADAQSRVFSVEVSVPNPEGQIRSGTIATVRVPGGAGVVPEGPAVPLAAIVRPPGKHEGYAVFVVAEDGGQQVARSREVELGAIAGNLVRVASGLERGERVVVVGASFLADGEQVNVLE
jgi:multidrug efflux system membrane fusion protein